MLLIFQQSKNVKRRDQIGSTLIFDGDENNAERMSLLSDDSLINEKNGSQVNVSVNGKFLSPIPLILCQI